MRKSELTEVIDGVNFPYKLLTKNKTVVMDNKRPVVACGSDGQPLIVLPGGSVVSRRDVIKLYLPVAKRFHVAERSVQE